MDTLSKLRDVIVAIEKMRNRIDISYSDLVEIKNDLERIEESIENTNNDSFYNMKYREQD